MRTDNSPKLADAAEPVQAMSTSQGGKRIDTYVARRVPVRECILVFACAFAVMFLFNIRVINLYDEGIELTGAMRTMAGQVMHRDFYYIYGPAQLYILAGLFKLFGPSVLVERLAAGCSDSLLVMSLYILTRRFCSRAISLAAAALCTTWVVGLILLQNLMKSTVPLLALWACWLIVSPEGAVSRRRRSAGAGLLAGTVFLFRYDMGVGIALANLLAAVLILWINRRDFVPAITAFAKEVLWPYLAGFGVLAVPAAILYFSVAPLHDLLYDIVLYSSKYYVASRRLPFPRLSGPQFEDLVVYVLAFLIVLSLVTAARWALAQRRAAGQSNAEMPQWVRLLISVGIAAGVAYMKGFVRISATQMSTSIMLCLMLAAILWQHRSLLHRWVRVTLTASLIVLFATALVSVKRWTIYPSGLHLQPMVINWIVSPRRQPPSPPLTSWCQFPTPVTRGMCFLLDPDHIRTVEYLDTHTTPADTLYVGLAHHDRVFTNDMATYFAAQRLPATKWAHFDPFLQNRADIQQQMIEELEQRKPPYVVLDSEFESVHEPNGSSVSTGVHLLDDYIAAHYSPVETYGELRVLKRD